MAISAFAQTPKTPPFVPNRYVLILADPPVAERFAAREQVRSAAAVSYRSQIAARQTALRRDLASRNIRVEGAVSTVLNAVFVTAPASRVDELRALPGVAAVAPRRRIAMHLNRAVQLMNAPAAWTALGGQSNAGAGVKIAILDSGIDQNHPAFQDSSLAVPAGFPKCNAPGDCTQFTNHKVIVARSYVPLFAAGSDPTNPAADSTPDDLSASDHVGHGTAVASAAAGNSNRGSVTFTGMAPKAYLGNYKVIGSPGVHDYTDTAAAILAIEDALQDGMDVAIFSSGAPAFSGPLDTGAACGLPAGTPCDALAAAFENAAQAGLVIVASAGNDGDSGLQYPSFTTINSPANAPSVLGVGALINSHVMTPTVAVKGLAPIAAVLGDSYSGIFGGGGPLLTTAPLVDVSAIGDGQACSAFPADSLDNAVALIAEGGNCQDSDKAGNASDAGAVGVILYADASVTSLLPPEGVDQFYGPVVIVANSDGLALKNYIGSKTGQSVTIDLAGGEQDTAAFSTQYGIAPAVAANQFASYSSVGPSLGNYAIKPDLVATGGFDPSGYVMPDPADPNLPVPRGMYVAAQSLDFLGELYSPNGYSAADGTSFSAPLVGGAAALVKQAHPGYTAAQIRSALLNSAAQDVTTDDFASPVDTEWIGAGRLDAGAAVAATVTVEPASLSFGVMKSGGSLPGPIALTVVNHGTAAVSLTVAVAAATAATSLKVVPDQTSLALPPGGSAVLKASLSGTVPPAGAYSGAITLTGSGVSLRVPYMFLVGDGSAFNITYGFVGGDGIAGQELGYQAVGITDAFGVATPNANVTYSLSPRGSATLSSVPGQPACTQATSTTSITCPTDAFGYSWVDVTLGPNPNTLTLNVSAAGARFSGTITSRIAPAIATGGVLPFGIVDPGTPVAPGQYVAITGAGLADFDDYYPVPPYAMALDNVNVSFDVPSAGLSIPARILAIDPNEIDIQVPWELRGQASAQLKVILNQSEFSNVVTVPVADYSPAFFNAAADAFDSAGNAIGAANPAKQGQNVQLIVGGLGPVNNQPADGMGAGSNATTQQQPVVTIGGKPATVVSSSLRPGSAGRYQVTVTVPSGITAGPAVPVTLSIAGVPAKAATLPVQ
jgi:uncharacterized protein (TIGR03437 family)